MEFASSILMVRPCAFGYNEETARTNSFQMMPKLNDASVHVEALREFDSFIERLSSAGIDVHILYDTPLPLKPDAIFPNNWFTTHHDGTLVLYPMLHENRRNESHPEAISFIENLVTTRHGHCTTIDLRHYENQRLFLEGTGSLVLDRRSRTAYVAESPRSCNEVVQSFCAQLNYTAHQFRTKTIASLPVYHTNVMMAIGDQVAVVCLEALSSSEEASLLRSSLEQTGRELLCITLDQMLHFAGNMIQLRSARATNVWVLSRQAWESLRKEQQILLERDAEIIYHDLSTIETIGGGSARCMIAEIF